MLMALEGTDAHGRDRVALGERLDVGRHPTNGLVLTHEGASRHHAVIERVGDGHTVRDLGSKNGTTVGGQPVEGARPLTPGAVLSFGGGPAWQVVQDGARAQAEPAPTRTSAGAPARLCLREIDGPGLVWSDRVLTIGRDPGNALVVDHPRVSGHHAVIELREDRWCLRDLGSRNGTTLDGRRVDGWRELSRGSRVSLGGRSRWVVAWASGPGGWQSPAHTEVDPEPPDLRLTLVWDGEDGRVRVEHGGEAWEEPAGQTFLLLWELAATPGEWVADEALKAALWGASAQRRARTALHTAIYNARRLFARHGLPGGLIEKDPTHRGRTRMNLPAAQVCREPTGSPGSPKGP
ncbi:MAG: FHA domain-containing protein [Pseudomonadota bacterium]